MITRKAEIDMIFDMKLRELASKTKELSYKNLSTIISSTTRKKELEEVFELTNVLKEYKEEYEKIGR